MVMSAAARSRAIAYENGRLPHLLPSPAGGGLSHLKRGASLLPSHPLLRWGGVGGGGTTPIKIAPHRQAGIACASFVSMRGHNEINCRAADARAPHPQPHDRASLDRTTARAGGGERCGSRSLSICDSPALQGRVRNSVTWLDLQFNPGACIPLSCRTPPAAPKT
jgi:hypothetical protein